MTWKPGQRWHFTPRLSPEIEAAIARAIKEFDDVSPADVVAKLEAERLHPLDLENPGRGARVQTIQQRTIDMDCEIDNRHTDDFDLIVGPFVKAPKGQWQKDGVPLVAGPDGVRATLLMATARHGRVAFVKSGDTVRPVVTDLKKYADCDPPRDRLPEGSSPYTILQILIDGELCTFAASSWGARKSFKRIMDQHRFMHPRQFPIVTLGTQPSGDLNDNLAPTFNAVAWVPISDFAETLVAERPQLAAPATMPTEAPRKLVTVTSGRAPEEAPPIAEDDANLGREIDDSIPF
jgi:hypothetical protein